MDAEDQEPGEQEAGAEQMAEELAADPFEEPDVTADVPTLMSRGDRMEYNAVALFNAAGVSMPEVSRVVLPTVGACWRLSLAEIAAPVAQACTAAQPFKYTGFHACSFHSAVGILSSGRLEARSWSHGGGDGLLFVRGMMDSPHKTARVPVIVSAFEEGSFGADGIVFEALATVSEFHSRLRSGGHDSQLLESRAGRVTHYGSGRGSAWTLPPQHTRLVALFLRESVFSDLDTDYLLQLQGL